MNWKRLVASRWRLALLLVLFGLLAIKIATGKVLAEPIDSPFFP